MKVTAHVLNESAERYQLMRDAAKKKADKAFAAFQDAESRMKSAQRRGDYIDADNWKMRAAAAATTRTGNGGRRQRVRGYGR